MINLVQGIYSSQSGAWSWALHRLTGIGIMVYLLGHIADTSFLILGPEAYNWALSLWRNPVAKTLEIALMFSVVYHSVNGVRVIMIDFWEGATKFHAQLTRVTWIVTAVIFVPAAAIMASRIFH